MRVNQIELSSFRSFETTGQIVLGDVNVLIGENNSGKSSIIRAIRYLQEGILDAAKDVRSGGNSVASVALWIDTEDKHPQVRGLDELQFIYKVESVDRLDGLVTVRVIDPNDAQIHQASTSANGQQFPLTFKSQEPNHFVVPFLSKRKTGGYSPIVNLAEAASMQIEAASLAAKVSRLSAPSFPGYALYSKACKEILGIEIASTPHQKGQMAGMYLPDGTAITIDQMGDGVPSVLFLLSYLATSKGKVFLIEELENDLHPKALKALLDLVAHSAQVDKNQFIISTHSNIVVTHLAKLEKFKLFRVSNERGAPVPTSTIEVVDATAQARIEVLQDLGYTLSDFHLYEGWLIFEEASAESICRNYLIPWFFPKLRKVRTIAAGGVDKVEAKYEDVGRLVLFTHLIPTYADRVWVLVDGDSAGLNVVEKLHNDFRRIPLDRFGSFDQNDFERYYPERFQEEANDALKIENRKLRQDAKNALRCKVEAWIDNNEVEAKAALEQSAKDVIEKLRKIERTFVKLS